MTNTNYCVILPTQQALKELKSYNYRDFGVIELTRNTNIVGVGGANGLLHLNLYIIESRDVTVGDVAYIPNGSFQTESIGEVVTSENIDTLKSLNANPVLSSTDIELTPHHVIDMYNSLCVIDYYNKNKKLPKDFTLTPTKNNLEVISMDIEKHSDIITKLNEIGLELNRKFGTESYELRCKLHDICESLK